ncbi:MAG: lipid-A-disaccharide synthase [Devosiaceae bacterium]|nr:lipid-A-disaccharide synthase [Devosiaceae bacterium]
MQEYSKSIFILAGEPSGDNIGADLIRSLQRFSKFKIYGVGGSNMRQVGLSSIFPMSDISVMGFADVIKRLPKLLWRIRQVVNFIIKNSPDVVVLIDSQEFSYLVAKQLRNRNYSKPILLYVAPAVWAWKPERAIKLEKVFDEILAIFPFEVEVMKNLRGPKTSYVGHPLLQKLKHENVKQTKQKGLVAIYPGSRKGEIRRHLPVFLQILQRLKNETGIEEFVLPTLPHLENDIKKQVSGLDISIKVISDNIERQEALKQTKFAIVSMGTITLELALEGVAMVGTYIPDNMQMRHFKKAGMPLISLPNILLGKEIIPEIFPDKNLTDNLYKFAKELLLNDDKRKAQKQSFQKMTTILQTGQVSKKQDPASRVISYL